MNLRKLSTAKIIINYCLLLIIHLNVIKSHVTFKVDSIKRHFSGDEFTLEDPESGWSGYSISSSNRSNSAICRCIDGSFPKNVSSAECKCQCKTSSPVFREDSVACVNTLNECPMVSFGLSGSSPHFHIDQNTQFVSAMDQLLVLDVNKTDEQKIVLPFCVIAEGQYLTKEGWKTMEGSSFDVPLQLVSGSDEIAFEWARNESSKKWSSGRLLLVNLLCKNAATSSMTLFKQCVTFRVAGSQSVQEAAFIIVDESVRSGGGGTSITRGVITGTGLLLGSLTLCYLLVSIFYFRLRKHKTDLENCLTSKEIENGKSAKSTENPKPNNGNVEIILNQPTFRFPRPIPVGEEANKRTPDYSSRTSGQQDEVSDEEIYSIPSPEEEKEGRRQRFERLQRERITSSSSKYFEEDLDDDYDTYEAAPSSLGLAIVETSGEDENETSQQEGVMNQSGKSVAGLKPKKKLFFSPAYFEPDMLQAPPQGALEFLSSVRAMMSVAKHRIQMKSFHPTLIDIPEDYGHLRGHRNDINRRKGDNLSIPKHEPEKENFLDEERTVPEPSVCGKEEKKSSVEQSISYSLNPCTDELDQNLSDEPKQTTANDRSSVNELIQALEIRSQMSNRSLGVKPKSLSFCAPRKDGSVLKSEVTVNGSNGTTPKQSTKPVVRSNSIKRNWSLKENKQQLKSSVENIKQEIQSKLNRVSSITRIQSFKKNKKEPNVDSSPESSLCTEARKNKVNRWLHSIEIQTSNEGDIINRTTPNDSTNNFALNGNCLFEGEEIPSVHSNLKYKDLKDVEAESQLSVPSNITSDETIPCQQDNEVSIIDINTHFYEKDSFQFSDSNPSSFILDSTDNISFDENASAGSISLSGSRSLLDDSSRTPQCRVSDIQQMFSQMEEENSYEEIQYRINPLKSASKLEVGGEFQSYASSNQKYNLLNDDCRNSHSSNLFLEKDEIQDPKYQSTIKRTSNNFLCIELCDESGKANAEKRNSFSIGGNKKRSDVKRNDSIIQDSLERPKVKKNLKHDEISTQNNDGANLNSLISSWNIHKPDKNSIVRRSKTMKTFKDYKRIKFCSSKSGENKLTFFGEGINLNYSSGKSSIEEKRVTKPPPTPSKSNKSLEMPSSLESLFHERNIDRNDGSTKPRIRYSSSFSPIGSGRHQKHIYHIYNDRPTIDNIVKNVSSINILNNLDEKTTNGNEFDSARVNKIINQPFHNDQFRKIPNDSDIIPKESNHWLNFQMAGKMALPQNHQVSKSMNVFPTSVEVVDKYTIAQQEMPISKLHSFSDPMNRSNFSNKSDVFITNDFNQTGTISCQTNANDDCFWDNDLSNYDIVPDPRVVVNNDNRESSKNAKQNKTNLERRDSWYKNQLSKLHIFPGDQARSSLKKSNSVTKQNSFKKRTSNFIHRSVSLHRMAPGNFGKSKLSSLTDQQNSSSPKFSIYVNDSFSIED